MLFPQPAQEGGPACIRSFVHCFQESEKCSASSTSTSDTAYGTLQLSSSSSSSSFHEKAMLLYFKLSKLCFQFGHATSSCHDQSLGMGACCNRTKRQPWLLLVHESSPLKDSKICIIACTTTLGRDCELVETAQERHTVVDGASMRTAHFQLASSWWMVSYIKKVSSWGL